MPRSTPPSPLRRTLTALAATALAVGGAAGGAAAADGTDVPRQLSPPGPSIGGLALDAPAPVRALDVQTPAFTDPADDNVGGGDQAVDLLSTQIRHVEGNEGVATDDTLLVTSILTNDLVDGDGARFIGGDLVAWYFDTDGNPATGAQPSGLGPVGAETVIALFGQPGGGAPVVELQRRVGNGWVFVRTLAGGEVLISENIDPVLGAVGLQVPRADIGVPRSGTLGLVQAATFESATDRAPDAGRYTLAIPRTPEAPGVTPAATTAAAGEGSLTFAAAVDAKELPTTVRFDYGTTTAYGSQSAPMDSGAGSAPAVVSATVTGLAPGTTYNYRVVATNAAGTTLGPNGTATTVVPTPDAQTGQATVTGSRTARLAGVVSTRGRAGTAWFQWGTARGRLARRTPARPVNGDRLAIQAPLSGLVGDRTYFYRVVVQTPGARTVGQTLALRTRPAHQVLADVGAPLGLLPDSRLYLRSLTARIRVVNPATGRTVRARAALQATRVDVQCTKGCRYARGFSLRARSVRVAPIGGRADDFLGGRARSSGTVGIRVPRARAQVSLNLLPLFTDGAGRPYLFRQGAEIVVRLSGPRLTPTATKIIVSSNARKLRCGVRGTRAVACRSS